MQFVLLMIRFIFRMASVFCKFILNDTQRCYTSSSWPKRIYTTVYHILNLHISQTSQLTIYLFRQPHKFIIRLNWLIFQLFLGVDIACKFAKYLLSSQLYQICYYPNCVVYLRCIFFTDTRPCKNGSTNTTYQQYDFKVAREGLFQWLLGREDLKNCCVQYFKTYLLKVMGLDHCISELQLKVN